MAVITGEEILKILRPLGIDQSKIISGSIHFAVKELVTVDIVSFVDIKNEKELETELKKYKLVRIEE